MNAPLLDLEAIDLQRLPKNLLDIKICQDYRVVVLSKRNNRLIVATADAFQVTTASSRRMQRMIDMGCLRETVPGVR